MRLGEDGLLELTKEELIAENKKLESHIATLLSRLDGTCTSGNIHISLLFIWTNV